MHKHDFILPALLAALALAACTAAQVQTAETELQAGLNAACTDVSAAAKANPNSPAAPWAKDCTPTGPVGLVANSATIQWLGGLAVQLQQPAAQAKTAPTS